jgi:hypothetical protein
MIELYYGDDIASVLSVQKKYKDLGFSYFWGDTAKLVSYFTSLSLFEQNKTVKLLVNLDSNVLVKLNSQTISLLQKYNNDSVILVLTMSGSLKLTTKQKKVFNKLTAFKLSDNKKVFFFLDNLFSKNLSKTLVSAESLIEDLGGMYLISMIFYNIKNMFYYYLDPYAFKKLHPYVQTKTASMAKEYSVLQLKNIALALSSADYKAKSSTTEKDIIYSLVYYINSL